MKVAVVLGHKLNNDKSITPITEQRLLLTLQLIQEHNPDKIILSGGVANMFAGVSEARVMREWLVEHGVDKELLIEEDKSLTTKQNAKFSVPILVELGAKTVLLCTSEEHMYRRYLNPLKLFQQQLKKYPNIQLHPYCKHLNDTEKGCE